MFKFVALFLITLGAMSCTKTTSDLSVTTASGEKLTLLESETLRINIVSEPPTLDWHRATDTTSNWVNVNMMEGLVEYDFTNKEPKLVPALAEKWESSEKSRKWKFTLRQNAKWSDGQPFTAQNVLDGWQRLLNRETTAEYAYFLFGIKNAKAFNEGKLAFDQVGVKITGPNEISVELERPMSYFPSLLTHASTYPIRIDVVKKFGDAWTQPQNIVTLGPFNLKSWQHDKMIVLERNESYFGPKPTLKYIAAYMLQEQATAINLFDSGKLDSVHQLPSIELRKLRGRKEYREAGSLLLYYYGMNAKKPPMDNLNVRKAIASAIDRQELVTMLAGGQTPLTGWIVPGVIGYDKSVGMPFDAAKAKEYLKAAGYADPSKFPKLEIKFNTNEDHQRIAENVQAQLKRNLGITVELKNEEWKVYLNTLKSDPPELFRFGWLADYPDPDNFMSILASYSENNHVHYNNPKFDALINEAGALEDPAARAKLYLEAQKLVLEQDTAVIPFYAGVTQMLVSDRVENYPINVMWRYQYKNVRLKSAVPKDAVKK